MHSESEMNARGKLSLLAIAVVVVATAFLAGCGDTVHLTYSTRSEAEADNLFEKGWLPDIIPPSSRAISMTNDLDLNTSKGAFEFDAADHDEFVAKLKRSASEDRDGLTAYSYEDWTFWIGPDKGNCKFYMRLSRD